MKVVIDGALIGTESDLHDALSGPLDFGPYYGRNLDALWDRLTVDVERPVELVWTRSEISRSNLGSVLFGRIERLLTDVMAGDEGKPPDRRFVVRFEREGVPGVADDRLG
ncbi:barstar family protein [Lentzea sp. NPDC055074]